PNGEKLYIPNDTVFFFTMNTIDASTEDVDDALIGRVSSVYCPPRVEDLNDILIKNNIDSVISEKVKELFNMIQTHYPLGHGYFVGYKSNMDFKKYYLSRIR